VLETTARWMRLYHMLLWASQMRAASHMRSHARGTSHARGDNALGHEFASVRSWADSLRGTGRPAPLRLLDDAGRPATKAFDSRCAGEAYAVLITQHSTGSKAVSHTQKNFDDKGGASGLASAMKVTGVVRSQLRLLVVLARSLRRVERCRRAIVILLGEMVTLPADVRVELSQLGIRIAAVPPLLLGTACLDKLHAWRLPFERVAMLDADVVVLQPLDDLFSRPEEFLIARHNGGGLEQAQCGLPKERWGIGAFFVLRPNLTAFSALSAFANGPMLNLPALETYSEQILLPCYFASTSHTMHPRWLWETGPGVSYKAQHCAGMPPLATPPPPPGAHEERTAGRRLAHAPSLESPVQSGLSLEQAALLLAAGNVSAHIKRLSPYLQHCLNNIRNKRISSVYRTCLFSPASRCLPQTPERMLDLCYGHPNLTSEEDCGFGAGHVHAWHFKGFAKPWREAYDTGECHRLAMRGYLRLEGLNGDASLEHSRRLASDDALQWRRPDAGHHGPALDACVSRLTGRRVLWARNTSEDAPPDRGNDAGAKPFALPRQCCTPNIAMKAYWHGLLNDTAIV